MKVNIEINDCLVGKMYDKNCDKNDCANCNCTVLPNEDYIGCYSKYGDIQLANDIQVIFTKIAEIM